MTETAASARLTISSALLLSAAALVSAVSLVSAAALVSRLPLADGQSPPSSRKVQACTLLTGAEVEAILGEPVEQRKASAQPTGGLLLGQCVFVTATATRSVSVAVAAPGPVRTSGVTPREFWQTEFHRHRRTAKPGSQPSSRLPRVIRGLGEEAYWVGNPITGALYILRGDLFLRISVGGIPDEPARIDKSIALARAALERL